MYEEDLNTVVVRCPNCGHTTQLEIDNSAGNQDYQDECSACGDLIHVQLQVDELHNKTKVHIEGNDG